MLSTELVVLTAVYHFGLISKSDLIPGDSPTVTAIHLKKPYTFVASLALAAIFSGSSFNLFAGTETKDLSVNSTDSVTCTIASHAVDFGAYDPMTIEPITLEGTGTVNVDCTSGSVVTITIGQGNNTGAGSTDAVPLRRMRTGASYLPYTLYSESDRTTLWGNTADTGVTRTERTINDALTVYGRLAPGLKVPEGNCGNKISDTVVVTVTF